MIHDPDRRTQLNVSGPWGIRMVLIGGAKTVWFLLGVILGLGAALWTR